MKPNKKKIQKSPQEEEYSGTSKQFRDDDDAQRRPKSTRRKLGSKILEDYCDIDDEEIESLKNKKRKMNTRIKTTGSKLQEEVDDSQGMQQYLEDLSEQDNKAKKVKKTRRSKKIEDSSEESKSDSEVSNELYDSDTNDEFCWRCKGKGSLLCCDYCFRSFHQSCAGQWECPQCVQYIESQCTYCKQPSCNFQQGKQAKIKEKTIDEELVFDKAVATCSKCNVLLHLKCIINDGVPIECILESPVNRKYFSSSELQQLSNELLTKGEDVDIRKQCDKLILDLLQQGRTLFHVCIDCLMVFGIGQILTHFKLNAQEETSKQRIYYLTLLEQSSYIHCHYLQYNTLNTVNNRKIKNYKEKYETDEDDGLLNLQEDEISEYLEVERIIGCKKVGPWRKMTWKQVLQNYDENEENCVYGNKNNLKFFVKWARLFYDLCTWEDECLLLKYKKEMRAYFLMKVFEDAQGTPAYEEEKKLHLIINFTPSMINRDKSQPLWMQGGSLHQFQIAGLDWLRSSWEKNNNVILADEMGLGKTIQTISFMNCLQYEFKKEGPYLIVAPATTLYNWLKEFKIWAEKFNVIVYNGNQESRDIIRRREFYYKRTNDKSPKICKFNAIITSYDTAINDQAQLRKIHWECLVVDEAHRLKNSESKFFKVSSQFQTNHKILLTGTPLQNNILELINLIEFIAPAKAKQIKNVESLKLLLNATQQLGQEQLFLSEDDKKKSLQELTKLLQPHILRRTKIDVKLQVPEMEEIIVKLCLTDTQKFLYKNILLKNYENLKVLDQKTKNVGRANLLNILMSLRLVCNHPFLFQFKRKFQVGDDPQELINQSNKIKFLDRIIPRLLDMNHKMLIFSQFTMMLDLLQGYIDNKGWTCERLDGNTGIMDRQKIIDNFNREESKTQIFLLSTRAGGLGINLTSADTIIFTDSDFNPYRDLQAISRAHRMGQKNIVKVFRLVSKYTAEERIIEIATKKLLLEEIIINPINKFSKDDFSQIFKNSTWELFNKNLEEKDQEFTEEQMNVLLQRNTSNDTDKTKQLSIVKNDLNDYYLSGFKFSSCNFEKAVDEQRDEDEVVKQDRMDKYWETLLDGEARMMVEKEYNELGKGKRVKKQYLPNYQDDALCNVLDNMNYNPSEYSPSHNNALSESDQDGNVGLDAQAGEQLIKYKKDIKAPSERMQKLIEKDQAIIKFFQTTVLENSEMKSLNNLTFEESKDLVVYGFSILHRLAFIDHVIHFGMEFDTLDIFYHQYNYLFQERLTINKPEVFKNEYIKPQFDEFKRYVKEFYAILLDFENFINKDNIVFCGLDPHLIFQKICALTCLKRKYAHYSKRPDKFIIKHEGYQRVKCRKSDGQIIYHNAWTNYDDYLLCKGIVEHGYGNWLIILTDKNIWNFPQEDDIPSWYLLFKKFNEQTFQQLQEENQIEQAQNYLVDMLGIKAQSLLNFLIETDEPI